MGVQRGRMQDLTALVKRHHHPLVGFLYRMTGGDRALAEDLVQETFLRVVHTIRQYQHPRPFKAWLYAIATNLTRDYFKRADTRRAADLPEDDARGAPDEALAQTEDDHTVAAALAALPEHQRVVVVLRYYQELSLAEIADALDIPVGTVKSRLSLGLGRLKELLDANS